MTHQSVGSMIHNLIADLTECNLVNQRSGIIWFVHYPKMENFGAIIKCYSPQWFLSACVDKISRLVCPLPYTSHGACEYNDGYNNSLTACR